MKMQKKILAEKQTKTEMSDNFDIETYNIDLYDELTKLNGDIEEFLGGFNFDKFYSLEFIFL